MITFKYSEYLELIPEETANFVRKLIGSLHYNEEIKVGPYEIYNENDLMFYKALKAYQDLNDNNKRYLAKIGFKDNTEITRYDYSYDTCSKTFSKYVRFFMPFDNIEDYVLLTPEDIVKNSYYDGQTSYYFISSDDDAFLKKLSSKSKERKQSISEEYFEDVYKKSPIAVINYYDTVSKIYEYLISNKKDIKSIEATEENIKALSFVLAIFYYNHISSYGDDYNEQKIMLDYFESIGLTAKKLENIININIPRDILNNKASIGVLKTKLNVDMLNRLEDGKHNIGSIFEEIVGEADLSYRRVLALCNTTVANAMGYKELLNEKLSELNGTSGNGMYDKDLMPSITKLIHRVTKIYTYLLTKMNDVDRSMYISTEKDLLVLSLFLAGYDIDWFGMEFFDEKGLTLDKVLKILELPNKEKYYEELEATKEEKKYTSLFKYLIHGGYCEGKAKSSIDYEKIYSNMARKDVSGSAIIHKLFLTATETKLDDNYIDTINNFFKEKRESKDYSLKEEIFANLSIDVYKYLKVVTSYYRVLKGKGLSQVDREQLAIILGASRYDGELEKYLDSIGLSRNSLAELFKTDWSYEESEIDINAIDTIFRKYIFDRDESQITVHTIFQNAFDPKLTNTVTLREVLFKVGKTPEDFLDIDKNLEEYRILKAAKSKEDRINKLNDKLTYYSGELFYIVTNVYDYLKANFNNPDLIKNDYELKQLALLIAESYYDFTEYKKYLNENGITTEFLLSLIGLDMNTFKKLIDNKRDTETLLEFEEFFEDVDKLTDKHIITNLFQSSGHKTDLAKRIVELLGKDFVQVAHNVYLKEEKKLSPEEEIALLSDLEILPVDDESVSAIATYGNDLFQHTNMINDSLNELLKGDSIDKSIEGINEALSAVVEERREPKKVGFWESMFSLEEPVTVVREYKAEKIGDLQKAIDSQGLTLIQELQEYENVKNHIELYLKKLEIQLAELRKSYENLDASVDNMDDISSFTAALNQKTKKELLASKISTVETMIVMMKQELVSVHRAIINHFITINALQTSKNAILPVLASELAINAGNKSESSAIDLTNNLFGLMQSVVNKNVDLTQSNLAKLRATSASNDLFASIDREVTQYLETVDRANKLLEEPKEISSREREEGIPPEEPPKLTLDPKN